MGFMDIFKPKYKSSNVEVRKKAVNKLTDSKILSEIALTDEEDEIRRIAIENPNLNDDNLFMKIIENNEDWHILDSALQKISDEKLLADLAKNNSDWRIRRDAVKKIEDETIITDIAKNPSEYYPVRLVAIEKISDQSVLTDIVSYPLCEPEIRKYILLNKRHNTENINDAYYDDMMLQIIRNTPPNTISDSSLRSLREALRRISKQESLVNLFQSKNPPCPSEILEEAFWRIKDENLLKILVIECPFNVYFKRSIMFSNGSSRSGSTRVSSAALNRIEDENILLDILKNSPDAYIREEARTTLERKSSDLLKEEDKNIADKINSLKEDNDESAMAKIVLSNENSDDNRLNALEAIDDEEILKQIVTAESNLGIKDYKSEALEKISDEKILESIVFTHESESISVGAINKIQNQQILTNIAKDAQETKLREEAIRKLTDENTLKELTNDKTMETFTIREMVGYSDHDGPEYEYTKGERYPISDAAKSRLKEINPEYDENI